MTTKMIKHCSLLSFLTLLTGCDPKAEQSQNNTASVNEAPIEEEKLSPAFLALQEKLHKAQGQPALMNMTIRTMSGKGMTPAEFHRLLEEFVPEDQQGRLIRSWFLQLGKVGLSDVKEGYALLKSPEHKALALKQASLSLMNTDPVGHFSWLETLGEGEQIEKTRKQAIGRFGALSKGSKREAFLSRIDDIGKLKLEEKEQEIIFRSLAQGLGREKLVDQAFIDDNLARFPALVHNSVYRAYVEGMSAEDLLTNYHSLKIPDTFKPMIDYTAVTQISKVADLATSLEFVNGFTETKQRSLRTAVFLKEGVEENGKEALAILKAIENENTFRMVSKSLERRLKEKNPAVAAEIEALIEERKASSGQ